MLVFFLFDGTAALRATPRWWKGNLHTHSLWSDGDDYPEMIADWYKANGYDFLALSDHNILQTSMDRWITLGRGTNDTAFRNYVGRFGAGWVEQRVVNGTNFQVRLKTLKEFRVLFEETNKFLLIQNEEITGGFYALPVHVVATNVKELIFTPGGKSVLEVMQNSINLVNAQRKATGQAMIAHIAHPNWGWGITAEDMAQVKGEKFFEVYNGHPGVRNLGDAMHASTERIWDILLAQRLAQLNLEPLFGLAVDDAHQYLGNSPSAANSGRGWVMVRAENLTPENLIAALEAGDFYASSGVILNDVRRETNRIAINIRAETNVTYVTQFIGTQAGYDPRSEPVRETNGAPLQVTRVYSKSVGRILAEVAGANPDYILKGNEYYVRAKIISSKLKANAGYAMQREVECAWTQPMLITLPKLSIARPAPGQLHLSLSGESNLTYQIQFSTNLINWSPVSSNRGPSDFTPAPTSIADRVFYRAVVPAN